MPRGQKVSKKWGDDIWTQTMMQIPTKT